MLKTRMYLKIEYTEFMDKLYVWYERKRGIKLTSRFLFRHTEKMDSPLLRRKKLE